jgi:hypothetical protein
MSTRKRLVCPSKESIKFRVRDLELDLNAGPAIRYLIEKRGLSELELDGVLLSFRVGKSLISRRWKDRFNITQGQARTLANRLRTLASELSDSMTDSLKWEIRVYGPPGLDMAGQLREMAAIYERELLLANERAADAIDARRFLTSYVRHKTGKFHDRHVAAIISGALGWPDYTYDDHRKFRIRYVGEKWDSFVNKTGGLNPISDPPK